MATSTSVRSLAVPTSPPDRVEPVETALLDADGMALCRARAAIASEERIVDLSDLDAPDQVLDYYFGLGGRKVMLPLHEAVIEGWLETRWGPAGRQWWVELPRRTHGVRPGRGDSTWHCTPESSGMPPAT